MPKPRVRMRPRLQRWGQVVWALLAGVAALAPSCPAYGISMPAPPESGLELLSLEYAPASPIRVGDRLLLQATTNRASQLAHAQVQLVGDVPYVVHRIELHDDGIAPDVIGGDGVWTAEQVWLKKWGTPENATVEASLHWDNGAYDFNRAQAPPLTVLPLEKED